MLIGERVYCNFVLSGCIGEKWPSKSAELVAVYATEELFIIGVFPAHKTFAVSDSSHSENFLPLPREFDGLHDFDIAYAVNLCIAEVIRFLMCVRRKLDEAFSFILLTEKHLRVLPRKTLDLLVFEVGNCRVLKINIWPSFIHDEHVYILRSLDRSLPPVICEIG